MDPALFYMYGLKTTDNIEFLKFKCEEAENHIKQLSKRKNINIDYNKVNTKTLLTANDYRKELFKLYRIYYKHDA